MSATADKGPTVSKERSLQNSFEIIPYRMQYRTLFPVNYQQKALFGNVRHEAPYSRFVY